MSGIWAAAVVAVFALAILRSPLWLWGVSYAAFVALVNPQVLAGGAIAHGWWLPLLPAALFSLPSMRRILIAPLVLRAVKEAMGGISETEKQALEAGTVGWDAQLFGGRPDFGALLALPKPRLRREERLFIKEAVEPLCEMCDEWQIRKSRDLPPRVWSYLRRKGFFGLIIPRAYGGRQFSPQAQSQIISLIGSKSSAAAVTVMVPNSLGPGELLMHYGTREQKRRHLPRLARGEEIPCFALTGPHSGSDAANMPDVGVVCIRNYQGKPTMGIAVTWQKRYITLGPVATLLGLAFFVEDPEGLLGKGRDYRPGITVALIATSHRGVKIGSRHDPAGAAFQNGPNRGEDVFIPMDWVIGGAAQIGNGWRMLMDCLAAGRAISLPAMATAGVKSLLRVSGAYARVRSQFGIPLGKMEGIGERLANIAGEAYTLEAARSVTCAMLAKGDKPAVISALLKYQSTERMRKCINHAMDIHGGKGICDGRANYLLDSYQMAPVAITVEGANILSRSLIVFGQGALRCHPHLKAALECLRAPPPRRLRLMDETFCRHLKFSISNVFACFWHNLGGGRLLFAPKGFRHLAQEALNFSLLADVTICLLGSSLKRRQALSGRFADALSELYLLSTLLKRYRDDGSPREDQPILSWCVANCLFSYQQNILAILANYPSKPLGWLLRFLIFPLGARHHPPPDGLARKLAAQAQVAGRQRRRWTKGTYIPKAAAHPLALLEEGIRLAAGAEAPLAALQKFVRRGGSSFRYNHDYMKDAVKQRVLSLSDARLLRRYLAVVERLIRVDEFAADFSAGK